MERTHVVTLKRLGRARYAEALRWQLAAAEAVRASGGERLALLEHEPVYTLGARGDRRHLLVSTADLEARGAELLASDRGGDVTFHGPGQLVVYPILNLGARGLRLAEYVRGLEAAAIRTVATWGLQATRWPGRPGVWVGDAKLAAVGVRVQGGVTHHGLALNVDVDRGWFDAIVACGLQDAGVTSLARLLAAPPTVEDAGEAFATAFGEVFDSTLVEALETVHA